MPQFINPMSADMEEYVSAMIYASDGKIEGKTRLQKTAYVLQAKGLGFSDIVFDYYKYGPFSPEVAEAADDAKALGYIKMGEGEGPHAIPYTIFLSEEKSPQFEDCDQTKKILQALETIKPHTTLALELAATAIYLRENGYADNYLEEIRKRKPLKAASDERMERVKQLLSELEL